MQTCLHCAHLIGIFAKFDLDRDLIARVIFRLLPIKGPLCLAIDRSNWKFGSTDINIFMLAVPPKDKLDAVFGYIVEHPGCRSTEIIAYTSYPKTTLDRCLSDLKRQGLIEYRGSKKTGGYCVVGDSMERTAAETAQGQATDREEEPEVNESL